MNRRNFLNGLLTATAGFSILPPATTYGRIWKARRTLWIDTEHITLVDIEPPFFEIRNLSGDPIYLSLREEGQIIRSLGALKVGDVIKVHVPKSNGDIYAEGNAHILVTDSPGNRVSITPE